MIVDNSEEWIIAEAIASDKAVAKAVAAANARVAQVQGDGHKTLIDDLVEKFGEEVVANWDGSNEKAIVGALKKADSPDAVWVPHEIVMEKLDAVISRLAPLEDDGPDEEFMELLRSGEFLNIKLPTYDGVNDDNTV